MNNVTASRRRDACLSADKEKEKVAKKTAKSPKRLLLNKHEGNMDGMGVRKMEINVNEKSSRDKDGLNAEISRFCS